MLEEYRQSLTKLVDNAKEIDELTLEMTESAAAINKGSGAMKSDLLADQKRLEAEFGCDHRRDRAADPDPRRRRLPARLRLGASSSARAFPGR